MSIIDTTRAPAVTPMRAGTLAAAALRAEAELSPKPGLIDGRGSGAHHDMDLPLMLQSANVLEPWFVALASVANEMAGCDHRDADLRARLGVIGRRAEARMLEATGGINTHRGAIFTLGFLTAAAVHAGTAAPAAVAHVAGQMASVPDPARPETLSHGELVRLQHPGVGAAAHAAEGFPIVTDVALATLHQRRRAGASERAARVDALLAAMVALDDTCVLYRAGPDGLRFLQRSAAAVLRAGGLSTPDGRRLFDSLDRSCAERRLSPGGAADVLAAALFLDLLNRSTEGNVCKS
jgi:triphosphoribosyl-dephospho-CoA synthase